MLKRILVLSAAAGATGWLAAPPAARLARGARPVLASARPLCRPFAADAAAAGRCAAPRLMADAAVVPAPAEEGEETPLPRPERSFDVEYSFPLRASPPSSCCWN